MKMARVATVALVLGLSAALVSAGGPSPPALPPVPPPSVADQMKALGEQIAALQTLVTSQQASIQALQKALSQMQAQLAALKRAQPPPPQEPPGPRTTSIAGNPVMGNPKAPLTIIEFSDFQCPFCSRWHHDTFPQLKKDYIDTGKVRFSYRDLPLTSIHPRALPAALAAECANEQGRFWEYHDRLFENQTSMSDENLLKWAGDLKLNTDAFTACMTTQKYKAEIERDAADAQKVGINGTPGFIVGLSRPDGSVEGIYISGAVPYNVFTQAIESLLKAPAPVSPLAPANPPPSGPLP